MCKELKIKYLCIALLFTLAGCWQESGILLTDTWAGPEGAAFKTWKDGYPGKKNKYIGIGCKAVNGDRVGFHVAWRDYGIKEHEGSFQNDIPDGEWSYFHKNGALSSRGFFESGKRNGVWLYWDNEGSFLREATYDSGLNIDKTSSQSNETDD